MTSTSQSRLNIWPIVLSAGLFVCGVLAVAAAKKAGLIDYDSAARAANVFMGLILMVAGNYFPKIARPLGARIEATARALAADRLAGRVLMGAGLAYALLWALAPFDLDWVKFTGSAGVLLVFSGVGIHQAIVAHGDLVPFQHHRPTSRAEWTRGGLFLIMHALMWAFAMILADFLWGDGSAIWMIVAFVLTNGLITSFGLARRAPN